MERRGERTAGRVVAVQSENRCLAETVGELRRMGGAEIARQLKTLLGDPSESERRSWENSIPVLLDVLHRAGLDRLRLALEYQTPMGNRIDGVLLGEGRKSGRPTALIIELKQWTDIEVDRYRRAFP